MAYKGIKQKKARTHVYVNKPEAFHALEKNILFLREDKLYHNLEGMYLQRRQLHKVMK